MVAIMTVIADLVDVAGTKMRSCAEWLHVIKSQGEVGWG